MFQKCENTMYLRFAHDLGSGKAKRLCANAIVAPIVSSVNVRSTDILQRETNKKQNQIITIVFKRKSQHLKLRQLSSIRLASFTRKRFHLIPMNIWESSCLHFDYTCARIRTQTRTQTRSTSVSTVQLYIYPHLFPHSLYDKHNHRFLFTFNSCIDQMQTNRARYIDDNKNYMLLFLHRI